MKHAILLALIEALRSKGSLSVVETHAGAGLYDLQGEAAQRSSEAEGGVGRLMAAEGALPEALGALKAAVRRANPDGGLRFYPGSPLLAVQALAGRGDYAGCELREDDFASLRAVLKATKAKLLQADGYAALGGLLSENALVLIDPPFERGDDYDRAAEAVALCQRRKAAVAVWAPIKDLETLDALVRRIEALRPRRLTLAEVRLRPLASPMKMNGCAMLLVDGPDIDAEAAAVCRWVAEHCGEAGARGDALRLIG